MRVAKLSLIEDRVARNRHEYDELMASGRFDPIRSMFFSSGGFVITHREHNVITDHNKNKEDVAAELLARAGYRVYFDSERSVMIRDKKADGYLEKKRMEVKTLNVVRFDEKFKRLANDLYDADKQGAEVAVVYVNNRDATDAFINRQINLYKSATGKVNDKLRQVVILKDGKIKWRKV